MTQAQIRLLVVDDERGLCAGVQEALQREGYSVDAAHDAAGALAHCAQRLYNVVLTDVRMPGRDGLELMHAVKALSPDTQVILMTAYGTVASAVQAMKDGAYDYIAKPVDMQRLRTLVLKALEYQALVAENHELRSRLRRRSEPGPLLGESEAIQHLTRLIAEVAQSEITVLIEGESGTGKELVARSIHEQSPRAARQFISVNCAALPEQLLEAELFGHTRGAFTGAIANKPGRFQLADGGTLFLDEIGDLSPKGQGDLLRVLEDGTFRMVGGTDLVRVDVRVIAATNKKLHETVAAGRFREDLFYRLQIVPLVLPPLRDRPEDIPILASTFLEQSCLRHRRRPKRLSKPVLQRFRCFAWPGNVRQLRNLMERLAITCKRTEVGVDDLPDFLKEPGPGAAPLSLRPGMSLAEAERLLIQATLTRVTPHRDEAARLLGISRRSLQYKLKEYGLLNDPGSKTSPGAPEPESGGPPAGG